jgi:hypothetical protein
MPCSKAFAELLALGRHARQMLRERKVPADRAKVREESLRA